MCDSFSLTGSKISLLSILRSHVPELSVSDCDRFTAAAVSSHFPKNIEHISAHHVGTSIILCKLVVNFTSPPLARRDVGRILLNGGRSGFFNILCPPSGERFAGRSTGPSWQVFEQGTSCDPDFGRDGGVDAVARLAGEDAGLAGAADAGGSTS